MLDKFHNALRVIFWVFLVFSSETSAGESKIAAASSLGFVLPDIAKDYRAITGKSVKLIFSSSRNLVRQIVAGAPFEVFLSADSESIQILQDGALTEGPKVSYGKGRLALIALKKLDGNKSSDLKFLAKNSEILSVGNVAIANPEIAPYGRIARNVLQAVGIWDRLLNKLVVGQTASQTAQFVVSGNVDFAFVPFSLALNLDFVDSGRSILVSEKLYSPLEHEMVRIRGCGKEATAFFNFLQSETAQSRFRSSGL